MGLLQRIARLVRKYRTVERPKTESDDFRRCRFETMEGRRLLNADPIRFGGVYIEEDSGSDAHGDTFEITFLGGAPNTQLTRVAISGDQAAQGFGLGDVFFDSKSGGLGADHAFGFQVVSLQTQDPTASVSASVDDGSLSVILDFQRFQAGDKLVFSLDVDEVEDFDPAETDLSVVNDGMDPITSGVEFQSSKLTGFFQAPHYYDATGTSEYLNRYDDQLTGKGLNLSADNEAGKRDRSAGTAMQIGQSPLPIAISGTVFVEKNLDLVQDVGEAGLSNVGISLWQKQGDSYVFTGQSTQTDANGQYEFGKQLGLLPGTYQVRETQPGGLFSVGAIPGTVDGQSSGVTVAGNRDILTEIDIPLGDQHSINNDFSEAEPARISGYVFHDRSNEGLRGAGEEGLGGVTVQVIPVNTIVPQNTVTLQTDSNGLYEALNLSPGSYRIVEVSQPQGYFDGLDRAGTVENNDVGNAVNPGDRLENIQLLGGQAGLEYNFGEIAPASIRGQVHLTDKDGNCFAPGVTPRPIENVLLRLLDSQGQQIAEIRTNANGEYEFTGLQPGVYTVVEVTPDGLIDGDDHVGDVGGDPRGQLTGNDRVSGITLGPDQHGVGYDFCEHEPSRISGFVYHDANDNGRREPGEIPVANVLIELRDQDGKSVGTTTTNSDGFYEFVQLSAGTYRIVEKQPNGWFDGQDTAGTVDGTNVGLAGNDELREVQIGWGQTGADYNFGELLPGSIAGRVHLDTNGNCILDPNELPLGGVTIQLLDSTGNVIGTTQTNDGGEYAFTGLAPGTYGIRELQPNGVFHGGQFAGSNGGNDSQSDVITGVVVGSGQTLVDYNFCEEPPSTISGMVFSDPNQDCVFNVGDSPLGNVTIQLLDSQGNVIATTLTDTDGKYKFEGLAAGTYSVRELQPSGLFHGGQTAGSNGGVDTLSDLISQITIGAGQDLVDYNFCETPPSSLSGMVFADPNGDCTFNPGDTPLAGVKIQLLDANGSIVATTSTDSDGRYLFDGLAPGNYQVRELQPGGYYHGGQTAGSGGGTTPQADLISEILIGGGQNLVDYNFCELPPSSLSGIIFSDPNGDCVLNGGEAGLANVTVQLLDSQGQVVATKQTDTQGRYKFENLAPGTYSVRELQPATYFNGGHQAGSGGGNATTENLVSQIDIAGGVDLVDYDFCETPPANLSGYVFQDGPAIQTTNGLPPSNLGEIRDGTHTPDDKPLAGVLIQLRDGFTGDPIDASEALPGQYPPGPIQARTDASGRYEFRNITGGRSYAVYQVHPTGYVDSIDTAGTTTGFAFNPQVAPGQLMLEPLAGQPASDAIIRIALAPGQTSENNNFSEVQVETMILPPPPEPPVIPPLPQIPPPRVVSTPISLPASTNPAPTYIAWSAPRLSLYHDVGAASVGYSWHLSVVNGGMPRDMASASGAEEIAWRSVSLLDETQWRTEQFQDARWVIGVQPDGATPVASNSLLFGISGSRPITGDFDGDGKSEIGIYYRGEWFIDLNGNGQWDEQDLWAKLGDELDRPVVGDWDGDGKDDIGIHGPEWFGDQRQILHEPGLPDSHNDAKDNSTNNPKNIPPTVAEATDGHRVLQLRENGSPRADVIDHVFRYGAERDTPVAGDWNGDGIRTIGVFHDGKWRIDSNGDGMLAKKDTVMSFGQTGDIPVVGDWDGNGVEEIGVYRLGKWYLDVNGNRELDAHDKIFEMGGATDRPVVGDWNGDGVDEPGIYRELKPRNEVHVNN